MRSYMYVVIGQLVDTVFGPDDEVHNSTGIS